MHKISFKWITVYIDCESEQECLNVLEQYKKNMVMLMSIAILIIKKKIFGKTIGGKVMLKLGQSK